MTLNWALGVSSHDPRSIEILTNAGQTHLIDLEALIKEGIPSSQKTNRLVFEGEFSSWQQGSAHAFLIGLGLALPQDCENRHEVFTLETDKGVTVHVPALVLMRAFFKPHRFVLPAAFTPAGVNLLSFVDYSATPPTVVIDDVSCGKHMANEVKSATYDRPLNWLQLSKSAHKTAQSVFRNALDGQLSLALPDGQVRIAFHGLLNGNCLYATKAALVSVQVAADDSITGNQEEIIFHAMADPERKPTASLKSLRVPSHPEGSSAISQKEWESIRPILKANITTGPVCHSHRELLDVVLYKLTSGLPWKKVPRGGFAVTNLTTAFRSWSADGRLEKVLAYLAVSRGRERLLPLGHPEI